MNLSALTPALLLSSAKLRFVALSLSLVVLTIPANIAKAAETDQRMLEMAARIDELIASRLESRQFEPAPLASDGEFLRRAHLDLVGSIPTVAQTRAYLAEDSPEKRVRLVERLLQSPAHPSHMANTWRRLILKPSDDPQRFRNEQGLQAWLRERFVVNTRYDRLIEEFLTATQGDNGPGYFYTALELQPEMLAAETSRIFLGLRLECAQCHDHPFDRWKQKDFWGVAAYFAQLERPGENVVGRGNFDIVDASTGEVMLPDTEEVVPPAFPGTDQDYASFGGTRRQQLAIWMVSRDNPFMPRRAVNWAWAHMMGRGMVHPADDMSPQNEPSHPALLDELTDYFVATGFDIQRLLQTIAITETYARASTEVSTSQAPDSYFAKMAVKTLTPEQLYDAFLKVGLNREEAVANMGAVPVFPSRNRIAFITRMQTAGTDRTEFDTGMPQALAIMNGPPVTTATRAESSGILKALSAPFLKDEQRLETLFLAAYSRRPTSDELDEFTSYLEAYPADQQSQALGDVLWVLTNSAEFMLNH